MKTLKHTVMPPALDRIVPPGSKLTIRSMQKSAMNQWYFWLHEN